MSGPLYVIPDIHGHLGKLDRALSLIRRDGGADAPIVFLGDYVDRGPDSRGVLQRLVDGMEAGRPWTLLRGNHEAMMLDALAADEPPGRRGRLSWFNEHVSGQTLASYGLSRHDPSATIHRAIPQAHLDLIGQTKLWHATESLILVHAGLRPGVALQDQRTEDLLWIRAPFLSDRSDHGRLVVHGHSAVPWPEHHGNRVALDGGAGWDRALHVAVFEGRACWLLGAHGRQSLPAP
jgi:serine/threonine protein phosphatase 1